VTNQILKQEPADTRILQKLITVNIALGNRHLFLSGNNPKQCDYVWTPYDGWVSNNNCKNFFKSNIPTAANKMTHALTVRPE